MNQKSNANVDLGGLVAAMENHLNLKTQVSLIRTRWELRCRSCES